MLQQIVFTDDYILSLIKDRERIIALCKLNNIKKRRTVNKKRKSMKEMIMSLEGEELDAYLKDQGFTLNKM